MRPEDSKGAGRQGGAIRLVARRLDPEVEEALDALPASSLPAIRMAGPLAGLRRETASRLSGLPPELAEWLAKDVSDLGHAYAAQAKVSRVAVRLEGISGDACSRFHVDAVRLRLLSTYRGPGTEYLPDGWDGTLDADGLPPAGEVLRMARGDHAVIRGSKGGHAGLVHRSPPLAGTGVTRLFLSVDEA